MKRGKLLISLMAILVVCLTFCIALITFAEEGEYTFDDNSHFVPGKWDAQKGRVNTVVTEDGEELTFKVIDKQPTQSRAYSEAIDITEDTKISFQIKDIGIDAGFSISFLATDDDYPMHIYGDGFRVLFKATQTSLVASTTVHSRADDIPDDFIGNGGYTIVDGTDYLTHTYSVRIADYNAKESTVKVYLDVDETNVDSLTVNFDDLSPSLDPETCYLLLTPEIDHGVATSWEKPVKVLLTEYSVHPTFSDEYKITYMNGDKIVKVSYTDAGFKFTKYIPEDAGFVAWYTDAEFKTEFDFDTLAEEDVVVYGYYSGQTTDEPTEAPTEAPTETAATDAPVITEAPKETEAPKSEDNTLKKNNGWLIPVIIGGVAVVAAVAIIAVVSKNKKKKA